MQIKKLLASALTAGLMLSFIPAASMADSTGWQGNYSDGWRYYTSDSDYVKNDWKKIEGEWYYFDGSGYMQTGWLKSGNTWYYLRSNGSMISDSWEIIGGKLYCFNSSGAMEANKWINCGEYYVGGQLEEMCWHEDTAEVVAQYRGKKLWRYVGSDGAAYTGWKKVDGEWYHFNDTEYKDGYMLDTDSYHQGAYAVMTYGTFTDAETDAIYHTDGDGKYLRSGWTQGVSFYAPQDWYYFGSDGKMYIGWHQINGKWYYFGGDDWESGFMCRGRIETYENGYEIWVLDENGAMQTGWCRAEGGRWFYARSNGSCYHEEWLYDGGKWYYFNNIGRMYEKVTNLEINGKGYDFDSSGACTNPSGRKITGWYERKYDSQHRYVDWESNDWSYFDSDGNKIVDTQNYLIDGKYYDFDAKGVCKNPYSGRTYEAFS